MTERMSEDRYTELVGKSALHTINSAEIMQMAAELDRTRLAEERLQTENTALRDAVATLQLHIVSHGGTIPKGGGFPGPHTAEDHIRRIVREEINDLGKQGWVKFDLFPKEPTDG